MTVHGRLQVIVNDRFAVEYPGPARSEWPTASETP